LHFDTPGSFCRVSFQHEPAFPAFAGNVHLVGNQRDTESALWALRLRKGGTNGMVPFVGLRRPFSPQAERLLEETMSKKSKAVASEPVGIVIATGQTVPSAPRVRAYFWFEESPTAGQEEGEK
jgi:hypothetical protein